MQVRSSYTAEEFRRLVSRESDRIERKAGVGQDPLQEALVAQSNSQGGVIFVGVRDNGEVPGRRLDQQTENKIHEAALAARDVGRYHISEVDVAGTPVVAVRVDRRVEGFAQTSNGRVLVRRGARNVALFGADLARFIRERGLRRFEQTDTGLDASAIDRDFLSEVASVFAWGRRSHEPTSRLAEQGLMTSDDHLTVAGALFLTDPARALRQNKAIVEVRRYPEGDSEYDRREEFGGPLHYQVARATEFILGEIGSDIIVTGLYRHELPKLPEVVVREAIANAVAHRLYEAQGTAIVVELRPDRVVVTSPGGLPEPVTVENIRQAQAARNQDVINVLRRFKLAEDAGRGVDVMQDSMAEALLHPPAFEDLGHAVKVTLPMLGPITPRERAWVSELERRGDIRADDKLLLIHAARGERLTNAKAREILRVAHMEAREALQRLRDAKLAEQHGFRGGTSYALVPDLAPPAAYRMSQRQLEDLILTEASKRPLSNEVVRQLTGLDRPRALALLRTLVKSRRLRRTGEKRGTRYVARGG